MRLDKLSWADFVREAEEKKISLFEFLLARTAEELETDKASVLARLSDMLKVMEESAAYGLTGVRSNSGLTGGNARKMSEAFPRKENERFVKLLGPLASDAVMYATAVTECNAAMGRICAAPTAGASGIVPGVLLALQKHEKLSRTKLVQGLLVAGVIGEVIADRATLAGATGGCQAECGSGAAMAAGAAVYMLGGDGHQIDTAISIVFKNVLGLVCDPVAGLVEVPCIKRNAGCTVQALLAAEMALLGVTSFIPADEAIDAMEQVGRSLPHGLRETAEGGMATTPTALAWARKYFGR
ncbi:MAG: L-serine dehydratase [Succiniclasticum sp.]|jgi:L-serine dehydratase